jgi:hypothetical protein
MNLQRQFKLSHKHQFFSVIRVVFIGGIGSAWVLSEIYKLNLL